MKTLQGFYKYKSPTNIHLVNPNYYNSHSNHKIDYKYSNLYSINYNNIRNNEIKTENINADKYFLKSQNLFAKDFKRFNIPNNLNQETEQNKVKNQNKLNSNFYLSSHKFYSTTNHNEKYLKNNMATLPTIRTCYTTSHSQNPTRNNNFYDEIINNYKNSIINKNIHISSLTTNTNNINQFNQYQIKSNSQTKNNNRYFQSIDTSSNNIKNNHSPSTKINFFRNTNLLTKIDESTKSLTYFTKLVYPLYKNAKQSEKSFDIISSYAANTYKGTVRNYNEDRISVIVNVKHNNYHNLKDKTSSKISFFAIYDGHAGNKCCEYLKNNLHILIFESNFFPENPVKAIQQAFDKCEKNFSETNQKKNKNQKNKLLSNYDNSGSCAIIIIIINDNCYTVNLGDSRALYSYNTGNKFYQLSRDHKPNDPLEKTRIYKAGGSIYKTNLASYGLNFQVNESNLGFQIPYRILPGRLAVSKFYYYYNIFNYNLYLSIGCKSFWRYKF